MMRRILLLTLCLQVAAGFIPGARQQGRAQPNTRVRTLQSQHNKRAGVLTVRPDERAAKGGGRKPQAKNLDVSAILKQNSKVIPIKMLAEKISAAQVMARAAVHEKGFAPVAQPSFRARLAENGRTATSIQASPAPTVSVAFTLSSIQPKASFRSRLEQETRRAAPAPAATAAQPQMQATAAVSSPLAPKALESVASIISPSFRARFDQDQRRRALPAALLAAAPVAPVTATVVVVNKPAQQPSVPSSSSPSFRARLAANEKTRTTTTTTTPGVVAAPMPILPTIAAAATTISYRARADAQDKTRRPTKPSILSAPYVAAAAAPITPAASTTRPMAAKPSASSSTSFRTRFEKEAGPRARLVQTAKAIAASSVRAAVAATVMKSIVAGKRKVMRKKTVYTPAPANTAAAPEHPKGATMLRFRATEPTRASPSKQAAKSSRATSTFDTYLLPSHSSFVNTAKYLFSYPAIPSKQNKGRSTQAAGAATSGFRENDNKKRMFHFARDISAINQEERANHVSMPRYPALSVKATGKAALTPSAVRTKFSMSSSHTANCLRESMAGQMKAGTWETYF